MSTFNTAFGSLPTPAEQYGAKPAARQQPQLRGLRQPMRPRTFADLRKSGEARPAPPPPGLGGFFGSATPAPSARQQGAVNASGMLGQLQQLRQPSVGISAPSAPLSDMQRALITTLQQPVNLPSLQTATPSPSAPLQTAPSQPAPVQDVTPQPTPMPSAEAATGGRGGVGGDFPVTTNAVITPLPTSLGVDYKDRSWYDALGWISPEESSWWDKAQQLGKRFGFTPMQDVKGYGPISMDGRRALYTSMPPWGYGGWSSWGSGGWMSPQASVEVPDASGRITKLYETAPQEQFVAGLNTIATLSPEDLAVLRQVDSRIDSLAGWVSTTNANLSTPEGIQAAAAQASYDIGGGAANENLWMAMNAPTVDASAVPAEGTGTATGGAPAMPAPVTDGVSGGAAGGASWENNLTALLESMLQNPSGYQDQDFQRIRDAARANLEAEFGGQREALNEELARRGIYSSSIASGRLGDLAGQQARAMTTMETDLLRSMAETLGRDRSLAAQAGLDYMKVLQSDEQFQKDIELRTFQIMEDSRLRGISLSLEQARDLAQQEQFGRKLNQDWAIASMETTLREKLGLKQLQLDELRLNNENFWNDKNWMLKLAEIIGQGNLTPEQLNALGLPDGVKQKSQTNYNAVTTNTGVPQNAPSTWAPPLPGEPTTRMWGNTKYTYNPIMGWTWINT